MVEKVSSTGWTAATVNTGGGAGGNYSGASGGSGIVIISMRTREK
jgi:hypothetical protein